MHEILHVLEHTLLDNALILPFLFLTYLAIEALESRTGGKMQRFLARTHKAGPAIGAVAGVVPQCGFSAAASSLYAGGVITELYLAGGMRAGAMLAGLLAGSGVGMLVLFRTNRSVRDNVKILAVVYFSGVVLGGLFGALLF